jgi:hypothetical protein
MKYYLLVQKNQEESRVVEIGEKYRLQNFMRGYRLGIIACGWKSYGTYRDNDHWLVNGEGRGIRIYMLDEKEWGDL